MQKKSIQDLGKALRSAKNIVSVPTDTSIWDLVSPFKVFEDYDAGRVRAKRFGGPWLFTMKVNSLKVDFTHTWAPLERV